MKLGKMDDEKKIELLKKGNKNYEEIYQKAEKKSLKNRRKGEGKTLSMAQDKIEKAKTITVNQLYKFIKNSNMMGYIDSEEALIRVIKKMIEGKSAVAMYFQFITTDAKELTFKIYLKNLEN